MEYDILVADDNSSFRLVMSTIFRDAGFSIDVAKNGSDALKKFLTHRYRLIIVDLRMPVMDGAETINAIKKIDQDQPIVVISTYDNGKRKEILEAGVSHFLTKPVDMDELLGVAQKFVGRYVSRR